MTTRQDVIEKAREYLGTPFVHQGRLKRKGIDCIGLIVGVAKELGLFDYDHKSYDRYSDGTLLMQHMQQVYDLGTVESRQPGDVVVYWVAKATKHPQHVGILTDIGIIHTYDHVNKVVETHTHEKWTARMTHCFKWRGIA